MLKRLFMLIIALIVVATAIGWNKAHASRLEICEHVYHYAEHVMAYRQADIPIYSVVEELETKNAFPQYRPLYLLIIQDAYAKNLYSTRSLKIQMIERYAADWYFICIDAGE